MTTNHRFPSRAFTLIEMLVVVGIMAVLMGIAFAIPTHEARDGEVRSAAEELAAVMRETRTRAMRTNRSYGISFNIENAPGSSGRILNNRSGGHWYRVIGPSDALFWGPHQGSDYGGLLTLLWGKPPLYVGLNWLNGRGSSLWNDEMPVMKQYVDLVNRCWAEEAHRLTKGKVRFLALTDQDNGDNIWPALGGYYSKTYPRPWFGYWDTTTDPTKPELRTWGGYDPALKQEGQALYRADLVQPWNCKMQVNGRMISHSGFYYEGYEGEITGCVNPDDRLAFEDANGDGYGDKDPSKTYKLMVKDAPRPLIDGNWLDFTILFHPDGTVETDWFRLRNAQNFLPSPGFNRLFPPVKGYWQGGTDPGVVTLPNHLALATHPDFYFAGRMLANGVPDRCSGQAATQNSFDHTSARWGQSRVQREATDFVDRTGFYWITLAPDTRNDDGRYTSPEVALRDLGPIYRVGVSPAGDVKVIRVRTTNYQKRSFDPAITGVDWENKNKIWGFGSASFDYSKPSAPNYMNHALHNPDYSPRGEPVVDVVMPEMIRDRKWWWLVP